MLACSSPGRSGIGLSAAAAKGVEGTGQQRLSAEKDFEEFLDLRENGEELGAERAEVAGHDRVSRMAEVIL